MKPPERRERCAEHNKAIFGSRREAQDVMKRLRNDFSRQATPVRVYRDPECGCLHVTSVPQREKRKPMSATWSECPCCERVIGLNKAGRFYPHVPYERKSQAGFLDGGRRCIGSKKTMEEAGQAARERRELRAEWARSLGS